MYVQKKKNNITVTDSFYAWLNLMFHFSCYMFFLCYLMAVVVALQLLIRKLPGNVSLKLKWTFITMESKQKKTLEKLYFAFLEIEWENFLK